MVGMGAQVGTPAENIAKLDTRFHAMLQALGCHENTMARLGELGVDTVQALETLVDDRKGLREFLKDGLGLDPQKEPKIKHTIEAGKVTSAWEQCRKRVEVENTREAERIAQNLPPQLGVDDVPMLKKRFEKDFNKGRVITKAQCPSKPYLELKVGHAEVLWEAEKLTEVTSLAQAERHALSNANTKTFGIDEHTCSFKVVTKPFGVPMPDSSESLRARLRLMRNAYMFLKMKFPTKGVLATCTLAVWDSYIEWLFGDEVWNFVVKGEDGKPLACPHQGMVMSFDQACRARVATLMSEGTDIESAFDKVMSDAQLRNTALLAYFSTEVGTSKCRALSAPALQDFHGPASAQSASKRREGDRSGSEVQLSKRQRKAMAKAERDAAAQKKARALLGNAGGQQIGKKKAKKLLALQNGGVGDGGLNLVQAFANFKGMGKGRLETAEGRRICFAYNNGQQCKSTPCPFAHVCQNCDGDHPKTSPNCPKKGGA